MSLHRLIYYSASRLDHSNPTFRLEIDQILEASRRNNQIADLTGALIFSSGHFGQVLEGTQSALESAFERIQQDRRHGNVTLLRFEPTASRAFADWAMAYVGQTTGLLDDFNPKLDDNEILGDQLYSRLRSMVASAG